MRGVSRCTSDTAFLYCRGDHCVVRNAARYIARFTPIFRFSYVILSVAERNRRISIRFFDKLRMTGLGGIVLHIVIPTR